MEKSVFDSKLSEVAKSLMSYCVVRTSNQFDAEDLAQDIILEICKSAENIRNEEAFYGFVWSVANNVYKGWCKKKARVHECELSDTAALDAEIQTDGNENSFLFLLRRELGLLSQKYRRATILYYIENKSCSDISKELSVSESMVKYLLFKSRQILKEGMNMERNYGSQSYNPKELELLFWGNGADRYYHLAESKISQNILFACYNDKLTAEQISLEIGVSLPYMEEKLNELFENELIKKDGNRYYTNIVIFTKDFENEVNAKTSEIRNCIADICVGAMEKHEEEVRSLGFVGSDMNEASFSWQMTAFILYKAIFERLEDRIQITYPKDKYGTECFVWGYEKGEHSQWASRFGFGVSNAVNDEGDYIQFMDFPINGEMIQHYCFNRKNVSNVFLDIAKGETSHFSVNDKAVAADMIRRGYVISNEKGMRVNAPVFTQEQYGKLEEIFADTAAEIADAAEALTEEITKILKNHIPTHLKKSAHDMAYFRIFEDAVSAPVSILCDRKYLLPYSGDGCLPTTYVILK